jgi:hypothetical protein
MLHVLSPVQLLEEHRAENKKVSVHTPTPAVLPAEDLLLRLDAGK